MAFETVVQLDTSNVRLSNDSLVRLYVINSDIFLMDGSLMMVLHGLFFVIQCINAGL